MCSAPLRTVGWATLSPPWMGITMILVIFPAGCLVSLMETILAKVLSRCKASSRGEISKVEGDLYIPWNAGHHIDGQHAAEGFDDFSQRRLLGSEREAVTLPCEDKICPVLCLSCGGVILLRSRQQQWEEPDKYPTNADPI